jgi:hypothetical protein
MKLCLETASGGLGGRVVYVASLNTTTVPKKVIPPDQKVADNCFL